MSERQPLYVYGVTRSKVHPPHGGGIDGLPIRSVAVNGVAALVSEAPSGEVQATRDRLLTHARVLEEFAAAETVLPMRFGVVAPSEEVLRQDVLDARGKVLAGLLDRVEGLVEFGVRVVYNEALVLAEIVRDTPAVRRLQQRIRGRPADATYYDRIQLGELVAQALRKRATSDADHISSRLGRRAVDVRLRDPAMERMVLRAAFLVKRRAGGRFETAVRALDADPRLNVRLIGPMPPYSFVDGAIEPTGAGGRSWGS